MCKKQDTIKKACLYVDYFETKYPVTENITVFRNLHDYLFINFISLHNLLSTKATSPTCFL